MDIKHVHTEFAKWWLHFYDGFLQNGLPLEGNGGPAVVCHLVIKVTFYEKLRENKL